MRNGDNGDDLDLFRFGGGLSAVKLGVGLPRERLEGSLLRHHAILRILICFKNRRTASIVNKTKD
jgi:hypothetical protein